MTGEEARILRASGGVEIEDRVERVSGGPIGGRVSNLDFPISGFYMEPGRDRFGFSADGARLP
jgi:hypothetical protein